jgi:topoisomerase-4 subunit B
MLNFVPMPTPSAWQRSEISAFEPSLDEAERAAWLEKGLGGKGKIDVSRFKGLGEMDAKDLKETTMDPASRKLIRVSVDDEFPGETGDLVERLMGKKPELRFQYIQENARFVEELDV